jgi:hypothetical protein
MIADAIAIIYRLEYQMQDRARNLTSALSGWFAADRMRFATRKREKKNWDD